MAHKQQYESLPGKNGGEPPMASKEATVIVSQPAKLSPTEEYVLNLDPNTVAGWSVQEVNQNFLERAGLGYMAEMFSVNKINGKCLMLLTEGHLHELGITCLGDRIYLTELIGLLKKKKREAELSAAKWSGVTPAPGIAYKEDCGECCVAYFCPCCLAKTYWRVTGQGVFYKREPPCGLWTEVRTEYMDYRFFKDLELKTTRKCLCCCTATELEMYVDDHDSSGAQKEGEPPNPGAFHPHVLRHPEARNVEQIIRNSWNRARLVAE
ncbi:unnamed protein product [Porites lobata]|uniref:SAM domain-containing protein n=1 Tax=Porites lobata TaxID=104759 RepID=A0ABN8MWT2_9CNID|nr:unnamed protein product [Porites lobata]